MILFNILEGSRSFNFGVFGCYEDYNHITILFFAINVILFNIKRKIRGMFMKINTPLGVLEFSNLLGSYGFSSVESKKSMKTLDFQTFEEGLEVLWYFDEQMRARTRISGVKNLPLDYEYYCACGFSFNSGFAIKQIRCHKCQALMSQHKLSKMAV